MLRRNLKSGPVTVSTVQQVDDVHANRLDIYQLSDVFKCERGHLDNL